MSALLESLEGEPLTEPIFSTVETSAGTSITVGGQAFFMPFQRFDAFKTGVLDVLYYRLLLHCIT